MPARLAVREAFRFIAQPFADGQFVAIQKIRDREDFPSLCLNSCERQNAFTGLHPNAGGISLHNVTRYAVGAACLQRYVLRRGAPL